MVLLLPLVLVLVLVLAVSVWAERGMRTRSEPGPTLLNREAERAALDGLLEDLRSGRGRAVVMRGKAGVGKSALLEYAVGAAADMRVTRAAGVESERWNWRSPACISCARRCWTG